MSETAEQINHEPPTENQDPEERADVIVSVLAELLFVALPLLVVGIVVFHKDEGVGELFASPEWSFAAAILFGQAVVKLIPAAASGAIAERTVFLGAAAIVGGLAPSLTVLTILLSEKKATLGLQASQLFLFLAGALVYSYCAAAPRLSRIDEQLTAE